MNDPLQCVMTWSKLLLQPHLGSLSVLTTEALFQVHKWISGLRAFPHAVFSAYFIAVIYFSSHPPPLLLGLVSSYFSLKPGLITSLENLPIPLTMLIPPLEALCHPQCCFNFTLCVNWSISDSPISLKFLWGRTNLFFPLIVHLYSSRANHSAWHRPGV